LCFSAAIYTKTFWAYKALVTDFIPKDQYAKASGLVQLAGSAQYLISPFLAGILLTIIDIKFIFMIDISTFLIASVIICRKWGQIFILDI